MDKEVTKPALRVKKEKKKFFFKRGKREKKIPEYDRNTIWK